MAWSTRELARLAGTTVNTIRHYHRLGLLDRADLIAAADVPSRLRCVRAVRGIGRRTHIQRARPHRIACGLGE